MSYTENNNHDQNDVLHIGPHLVFEEVKLMENTNNLNVTCCKSSQGKNMFGFAICCAVGAIFAKSDCCSHNQGVSGVTGKVVSLIKFILMFLVVAGALTTAAVLVATTMGNDFPASFPTTSKTTLLTEVNLKTETILPVFSSTTIETSVTLTTKSDKSYGVLITGSGGWQVAGNTTELYLPSSGVSCSLPQLPDDRSSHSLESSGLLCGGVDTIDSCIKWSPDTGTWEELLTLDIGRYYHVSWTPGPDIGTYLIGGYTSEMKRTTTLIKPDGTQEPGFELKYDTSMACTIPDEDAVIISGGYDTLTTVSVYSPQGWQQNLPPLNTGRYSHACSSYWSDEGRFLIVTGGFRSSSSLDSTETFDSDLGSWATSIAKLPQTMSGLRAANIDGRVMIFGGSGGGGSYYDGILEYDLEEDTMVSVGHMMQPRLDHAVSVVQSQDYVQWCQED